jgi:hypothetical protein
LSFVATLRCVAQQRYATQKGWCFSKADASEQ